MNGLNQLYMFFYGVIRHSIWNNPEVEAHHKLKRQSPAELVALRDAALQFADVITQHYLKETAS